MKEHINDFLERKKTPRSKSLRSEQAKQRWALMNDDQRADMSRRMSESQTFEQRSTRATLSNDVYTTKRRKEAGLKAWATRRKKAKEKI
jgi:hypothetical protein